jgi:hypothetical protein
MQYASLVVLFAVMLVVIELDVLTNQEVVRYVGHGSVVRVKIPT